MTSVGHLSGANPGASLDTSHQTHSKSTPCVYPVLQALLSRMAQSKNTSGYGWLLRLQYDSGRILGEPRPQMPKPNPTIADPAQEANQLKVRPLNLRKKNKRPSKLVQKQMKSCECASRLSLLGPFPSAYYEYGESMQAVWVQAK